MPAAFAPHKNRIVCRESRSAGPLQMLLSNAPRRDCGAAGSVKARRTRGVKGTYFVDLRDAGDAGDAVELSERYEREGADELVLLDVTAAHEARATALDVLRRAAGRVFIPVTLGGGMRSVADMRAALAAGADTVGINSAAVARRARWHPPPRGR